MQGCARLKSILIMSHLSPPSDSRACAITTCAPAFRSTQDFSVKSNSLPGGESIYGKTFRDEWEHGIVHHTEPGHPVTRSLDVASDEVGSLEVMSKTNHQTHEFHSVGTSTISTRSISCTAYLMMARFAPFEPTLPRASNQEST